MTNAELATRIQALEHELNALKREVDLKTSGGWRATAGTFANDPLFERAMRYGAEYRRSTRPKPRTRKAKRK